MTEVLPNQRYNAHLVPEDGSFTCLKAGVCKSARFSCSCLCDRKRDSHLGLVWPIWSPSTSSSQGKSKNCTGGLRGAIFRVLDLIGGCKARGALHKLLRLRAQENSSLGDN